MNVHTINDGKKNKTKMLKKFDTLRHSWFSASNCWNCHTTAYVGVTRSASRNSVVNNRTLLIASAKQFPAFNRCSNMGTPPICRLFAFFVSAMATRLRDLF